MTEKEDKILFETTVALKKDGYDTLLTLTEKQLLFQKKKGLIQKKNKVVKTIELSDIKIIKGKVHIERQEEKVILHLKDNNFEFTCSDKKESKKLVDEISEAILGEDKIDRAINKADKTVQKLKKVANVIGDAAGVVGTVGAAIALKDNPKKFKEIGKKAINIIKKK